MLTSGLAWSADNYFYMWEGSVDGEVSHGLEGENAVAEPDLQADQEVPSPAEFDVHGALAVAAAVDQDDVEHAEEVVAQRNPDAEPLLVEVEKLVIEEYEESDGLGYFG